jgi:hypothetical protein
MDTPILVKKKLQGNDEISEEKEKKMAEETFQKWLLLQKTIKEEITLEDIIINQQEDDFNKLKDYYKKFYDLKLYTRKANEEIKNQKIYDASKDSKDTEIKKYCICDDIDKVLLQACEPIKNLLFLFRENYDYIVRLISLIDNQDETSQIESLVELFCNQFYDNILIPNPEQEELLILIYKLLEAEITPMNSATIDEFLHDTTSLGKFISSFMRRQELNVFLSILLNPMILSIENENDGCLDMSLFSIQNYVKEMKKKETDRNDSIKKDQDEMEIIEENELFKNIPKTKIHFKQNIQIEAEKEEENRRTVYSIANINYTVRGQDNDLRMSSNKDVLIDDYNEEYTELLTQEKLCSKLYEIKDDNDLKDFYEHQLEQIDNDSEIFSNKGLLEVLDEQCFIEDKYQIMYKYKKNFLFIQEKVDKIIQALIDKINSIPYTIRCISKIISLLISKKFPLLAKYLQNAFIGKFIFHKLIFPVLKLENKSVVENIIFSQETKKCLHVIISVLSTANKCLLFNCNTDTEKTIFNYYLIELVPILNKFYEKLIDIELPKALNDLVSKTNERMVENEDSHFFSFRRKRKASSETTPVPYIEAPLYDYFSENSDEILQLQCICFSLRDIFFIMSLINKDEKRFEGLPKYELFIKTIERIQNEEYKLDKQLSEEKTEKRFFLIYKDAKNAQLEKLYKQKNKKIKDDTIVESELICIKIKDCIKTILKGLNVLNNKDYTYLSTATSNEKFLKAIQYSLEDICEFSDSENEIPLNWYGQFIDNNKHLLDKMYSENDFEKLYQELYNEEINILNELKSFSSIIITRDGLNLRCAEKILEKYKNDKKRIEKAKKFQNIENFIDTTVIKVCFRIKEKNDDKNEKLGKLKQLFSKKEKEGKNEPAHFFTILEADKCPHKNSTIEEEKSHFKKFHANNINEFIKKFCNPKHPELMRLMKAIHMDIEIGENNNLNHDISYGFSEYMKLLKEKIKEHKEYFKNTTEDKFEKELEDFANKIEDHIMRKIYKYVFPENQQSRDAEFYYKTKLFDWITPQQLEIKQLYINQLGYALYCIKKMDEAKSVFEKLDCIKKVTVNINNTLKFSTGKNKDAGQDEITPILQYIVIKAHPKKMISNINYIKCFLDKNNTGQNRFLLTQIESAVTFILNIDYNLLKMKKEEFDKYVLEAGKRLNI